jgi:hypothetical protein
MNILEKIQKLQVFERKIILWIVMIIAAIFLFFFWTKIFNNDLQNLNKIDFPNQLKIPSLMEKLEKDLPKIKIPSDLKDLNKNSLMGQ